MNTTAICETTNSYDLFLRSVRESLQHWPVLRIARQQGFGGQQACEKEQWLCDSVVQIFTDNAEVHADELSDFISEAIFNEFNTIAEDGSLPQLSENLCYFYRSCKANDCQPVLNALNKMKTLVQNNANINVQKVDNLNEVDEDDEDEDMDSSTTTNGQHMNGTHGTHADADGMELVEERQPDVDEDG